MPILKTLETLNDNTTYFLTDINEFTFRGIKKYSFYINNIKYRSNVWLEQLLYKRDNLTNIKIRTLTGKTNIKSKRKYKNVLLIGTLSEKEITQQREKTEKLRKIQEQEIQRINKIKQEQKLLIKEIKQYLKSLTLQEKKIIINCLKKTIKNSRVTDTARKRYVKNNYMDIDHLFRLLVKQNNKCYYCNVEMEHIRDYTQGMHNNLLTTERIDNTKAHTKNNVVLCCWKCNTKRGDNYTSDEFKKLVKEHGKRFIKIECGRCKKIEYTKDLKRKHKNKNSCFGCSKWNRLNNHFKGKITFRKNHLEDFKNNPDYKFCLNCCYYRKKHQFYNPLTCNGFLDEKENKCYMCYNVRGIYKVDTNPIYKILFNNNS